MKQVVAGVMLILLFVMTTEASADDGNRTQVFYQKVDGRLQINVSMGVTIQFSVPLARYEPISTKTNILRLQDQFKAANIALRKAPNGPQDIQAFLDGPYSRRLPYEVLSRKEQEVALRGLNGTAKQTSLVVRLPAGDFAIQFIYFSAGERGLLLIVFSSSPFTPNDQEVQYLLDSLEVKATR